MPTRLPLFLLLALPVLDAATPPEVLIRNGHYKRARALAEERSRTSPNDPETFWLMSAVKQAWHDPNAAVDLADKAVAADSKSARYHFRLAEALGDVAQRAGVLKQLGLARRFKKEIDTTIALDPHNIDALTYLMQFHLRAPGIMGGDKTMGRAIPAQILSFDPVKGYFAQVELARFDKQNDKVEDFYRKAVAAGPASYDAQIALANWCGNNQKFEESETHARQAIQIDSDRVPGHILLAVCMVQQQKWSDLDTTLAEAERLIPDNLSPYYRAAMVCLGRKTDLARAERYVRKYLAQEPEPNATPHANAHWRLGQMIEQQGRKPEAIAEFQTAVKMDPNSPAKQDLKQLK
jgi:tetratricopeptide (TPR) repeat protein